MDALDLLVQYNLVRSKEELLGEIVHEDEQGVDLDIQTMAQIDAVPIVQTSTSSARPIYPSQTIEETNTPTA